MNRMMIWLGTIATGAIIALLGLNTLREPTRQAAEAIRLQNIAVAEGMELYAQNCVVCHGAAGEGLSAYPMLNTDALRAADYGMLFRTIERGRYGTAMAAYSSDEGGIFTDAQIDSLVALIQFGDWQVISARVAMLGLTLPEPVVTEIPADMLASVKSLPQGEQLAAGLTVYAANCTSCHGSNGEGSKIAPAINTTDLRTRLTDADLARIIGEGVPGTLMASWKRALSADDIGNLTLLIRNWETLSAAGIKLPVLAAPAIDMSAEAIATGKQLFSVLCTNCHGPEGFGTRLAPALNNKTFLENTSDAAIQQIIGSGVQGTAMPAWSGRLTDADIAAITAYLRSLAPTAPAVATGTTTGTTGLPVDQPKGPPWKRQ